MGNDLGRPSAGGTGFIKKDALDSVATPPSSDEGNSRRLIVPHPNGCAEAEFVTRVVALLDFFLPAAFCVSHITFFATAIREPERYLHMFARASQLCFPNFRFITAEVPESGPWASDAGGNCPYLHYTRFFKE